MELYDDGVSKTANAYGLDADIIREKAAMLSFYVRDMRGEEVVKNGLPHLLSYNVQQHIAEGRIEILNPGYAVDLKPVKVGKGAAQKYIMDYYGQSAENVLVLYGDVPFIKAETIAELVKLHENSKSLFSMLTTIVPNFENEYNSFMGFGRIIRDNKGKILKIQELLDASAEEKLIKEVNPGIYLFNTRWLKDQIGEIAKNKHGEHYLTDIVELAIKKGVAITTASVDPKEVFGVNTPQQLADAAKML